MIRKQFLAQLDSYLQSLSKAEREDILNDYNEYFDVGLEEGKTEEEIAFKLGSPKTIAKDLCANSSFDLAMSNPTISNTFRAIGATIGMSLFNLFIVLVPALVLGVFLLSGWVAGASLTLAPFLYAVSLLFNYDGFYAFEGFMILASCGIGILLLLLMYHLSILCAKSFVAYCKWNISIVKGGTKHA
ncbi:MAG: HAAS signaling domain-containing protein [Bacillus sp. (in: firmicutes)]